ncbi:MAG: amidohydrolase [Candidatus Binataceae bacterium]
MNPVHNDICRTIDRYEETAVSISHRIHEHPELKFEETFAAGLLVEAARGLGISAEAGAGGLKTAFRGEFGRPDGPTIAILAEYDALPNGHSCGHNLIACAALAAVAGLSGAADKVPGRIVFVGTPGEEMGGGKIILLDHGAFAGVDAAMMAHPLDAESCVSPTLAAKALQFTFTGKAAHAAAAPWNGASALAAVLQTFQSVDAARLHFRDGSRVHGIITNGGQAVNIIPERAECQFVARARGERDAEEMTSRIIKCAEAAALATGTKAAHQRLIAYKNVINNRAMALRYAAHSQELGTPAPEAGEAVSTASTDMGNVSHAIPSIHPVFQISDSGQGTCHEDVFAKYTDAPRAYSAMIRVAKSLAMTAYDLLAEPELLKAAKIEFEQSHEH